MDVNSSRTASNSYRNTQSATVEKTATFSRDTSNSSRNSQLQHQQHQDVKSIVKTPTLMGFAEIRKKLVKTAKNL
jgi:O-succinylbenzoate synthase